MDQASFTFMIKEYDSSLSIPEELPPVAAIKPEPEPAEVVVSPLGRNLAAQPAHTLADVLDVIDTWTDLPESTRKVHKSYIRTCGFVIASAQARAGGQLRTLSRKEVHLASMPFDIPWMNQWLHRNHWMVIGLKSEKSLQNALWGMRDIARQLGKLEPIHPPKTSSSSSWRPFLDVAVEDHTRPGITRFVAWCDGQAIEPAAVDAQTFVAYEAFVRSRLLHRNIPKLISSVKNHWKSTAAKVEGWPVLQFSGGHHSRTYTYPLSEYPLSFQNEVAAYARRLAGTEIRGPFRRIGTRRPLRPATIRYRLGCIRSAAAALVLSGRPISTIIGLADLVTPEAAEAILLFYWNRTSAARLARGDISDSEASQSSAGASSQTEGIAATLLTIARYDVKVEPDVLAQLKMMAADVRRPPQSGLTKKNRERLRQFDDPRVRLALLKLPGKLMKSALALTANPKIKPGVAARMAREAVMIGLLCRIPIRAQNLRTMRIGHNLKFPDASIRLANRLEFQASETKNWMDLEFSVGSSLANLLRIYIQKFLPFFSKQCPDFQEHGWLFPSAEGGAGPIGATTLAKCIKRPIAEYLGAEVYPHFFRSFAARLKLEHSPGSIEDVRLLLGDKTMTVVLRHYASLEPVTASRRHDELIEREQKRLSQIIAPPKGGRKGK